MRKLRADRLTVLAWNTPFVCGSDGGPGHFGRKRAQRPIPTPIRSALVACKPVQFGFARMFQTLNDNPRVQIRIFGKLEEAQQWLRSSRR